VKLLKIISFKEPSRFQLNKLDRILEGENLNKINEIVNQVGQEMAKKKDLWFLETIEKHKLIKSDNLSNFDLFWLHAEMGVKLVEDGSKTQIYLKDTLIGEWDNNYQFIKTNDDAYKYDVKVNCWN
jgi:hypothetical protein